MAKPDDEKQPDEKPDPDSKDGDEKPAGDDGDKLDKDAEIAKWKALSRKHEGQAKANSDAAKRLQEIEDANKSEVQKIADAKAASDKAAASAQGELMRLRVAMRKGLTETQAKRLMGDTEEELEADADELLETFGAQREPDSDKDGGKPTRPKERLRSGAAPDEEPDETDPQKLAADVPRL
jgi:hypothetical protein